MKLAPLGCYAAITLNNIITGKCNYTVSSTFHVFMFEIFAPLKRKVFFFSKCDLTFGSDSPNSLPFSAAWMLGNLVYYGTNE